MKNSICVPLIFLIPLLFFPLIQCRVNVFPVLDANLIHQTCKKTPKPDLCVSSLKADPRSSSADVAGLGLIMVDVVEAKATQALRKIKELLKQSPGEKAFISCAEYYNLVVQALVPEAKEAFSKGNPKFAEQGMSGSAKEAEDCERGFSAGRSPMTKLNKLAHGVAAVGAAIARILL